MPIVCAVLYYESFFTRLPNVDALTNMFLLSNIDKLDWCLYMSSLTRLHHL